MKFPFYRQLDQLDCGPACLRMIAKYYGKTYSSKFLEEKCNLGVNGTSFQDLVNASEYLGFKSLAVKTYYKNLADFVKLPCIAYWNQVHFVVIFKITSKFILIADPTYGLRKCTINEFLDGWLVNDEKGNLLVLEPTESFFKKHDEREKKVLSYLLNYIKPYKLFVLQLFIGILSVSVIQLLFPFLMQQLVDKGIKNQDIGFIYLILIGQLMLFIGQTSVNIIKSWILLHVGSRINIRIISDFLTKLMGLTVSFFDNKKLGDILQRINDSKRIENFLTNSALSTLFSLVNLVVFSFIFAIYSKEVFLIFLISSIFSAVWVIIFLRIRRELDHNFFSTYSDSYNKVFQLINGIRDIKLNSAEIQKRKDWENVQVNLFKVQNRNLKFSQYQNIGNLFFTQLKNIIIICIAAISVVNNEMTLGVMMAITYINGQLSIPIEQLMNFTQSGQDAKLSAERIIEIERLESEYDTGTGDSDNILLEDIIIRSLIFKYHNSDSRPILKKLNLTFEKGKITAIVGTSGSGKTTLLKLLLKFYSPTAGQIFLGKSNIYDVNTKLWRNKCGAVMQDSFIFSDTVASNIALGSEVIDNILLDKATKVANIYDFIQTLPFKYETKIGRDEHELSQGQKQRILIARAVYKNPQFLFFDEATNALDTENEIIIMNNLREFFKGKTVLIVAHRLSTVINADKIIVLDNGEIVEKGDHNSLLRNQKMYYNLIKNQLELNNHSESRARY